MRIIDDDLFEELNRLLDNRLIIPFVGAGFSVNVGGYPLWDDFMELLQNQLNEDIKPGDELVNFKKMFGENDPAECTQYFYWRKGYKENDSIINIIKKGKDAFRLLVFRKFVPPSFTINKYKQHSTLINKFNKIYTTNWDDLLEKTCLENDKGYIRITATINSNQYGGRYNIEEELSEKGDVEKRVIIKYHGCQDDQTGTSIIASTADYYERISVIHEHPLDKQISLDMINNNFLFIGYSLRDVNVKYLLNQINFQKWNNSSNVKDTKFYFITFDDPRLISYNKSKYLEACNYIVPITLCEESDELLNLYDKHDLLEKNKNQLNDKYEKGKIHEQYFKTKKKKLKNDLDDNEIEQRKIKKLKINLFLDKI